MKPLRTALFWLHLLSGVTAGVVILIMSATGVILALKPQIQDWIEREVRYVTPPGTPRLSAQQLLEAVKEAKSDASPQSLAVSRNPSAAAAVNFGGGEGIIYVNPYTGDILGTDATRTTAFFQSMTSWHRYLGATGEDRASGRSATGISNLAFLVLGVTGLFIWWPKQFSLQRFKPIVWFRRTSTGRARDFNWHNTIGFWCLIPIVIMTISGAVISYPWASDLVYRLTGSPIPTRAGGPANPVTAPANGRGANSGGGAEGNPQGPVSAVDLDQIWARAERQVPTWSLLSMRIPNREGGPLTFTITDGANWNAFARSNLTLNSLTGEVIQWQPYEGSNLGQKVRGWLRFAHTGELGGVPGQIIAGIGCLGGVFLVCTGLSLATRRLWNWSLWARLRSPRRPREASSPATAATHAREALID